VSDPTSTGDTGGTPLTGSGGGPTARQHLLDLHYGQGAAYAEISRRLGRSTPLLRFVATEQKPGSNLTGALRELATTGQVSAEPQQRTTAAGERARIGGGASATARSRAPPIRGPGRAALRPAGAGPASRLCLQRAILWIACAR
jgi:hypothetical protein